MDSNLADGRANSTFEPVDDRYCSNAPVCVNSLINPTCPEPFQI